MKNIGNKFFAGYDTVALGGADEVANTLQACLDADAKKVLLSITSASDFESVPSEFLGNFSLLFYDRVEDAVFKTLGVE